jgi:hypothetical protein
MSLYIKLLRFIGSKWFTFTILIVMGIALPITWHNFKVVLDAGMLSQFWYIGLVFGCNILGALFAFWKFMSMISGKNKASVSQQW